MVNNVYSTLDIAIKKAVEAMHERDESVYVTEHKYPSGVEYWLVPSADTFVYAALVNFKHHFAPNEEGKSKALDAAKKFEKQLGITIFVQMKTHLDKGYRIKEYYYLTKKKDV